MKQKLDRSEWFCCFFCFQPCSGQKAAKTTTALPRAPTIPGHITEEAQSTSQTAIDVIIAALDTGMAACIMFGRQVTGHGGPVRVPPAGAHYLTLVSSCGSMGTTSRKDTKPLHLARRQPTPPYSDLNAAKSGYPTEDCSNYMPPSPVSPAFPGTSRYQLVIGSVDCNW